MKTELTAFLQSQEQDMDNADLVVVLTVKVKPETHNLDMGGGCFADANQPFTVEQVLELRNKMHRAVEDMVEDSYGPADFVVESDEVTMNGVDLRNKEETWQEVIGDDE